MSKGKSRAWCIWDDCANTAIYCEGHAREFMAPEVNALKARVTELEQELAKSKQQTVEAGWADWAKEDAMYARARAAEEESRLLQICDDKHDAQMKDLEP